MIREEKTWFDDDRSYIPSWMRFGVSLAMQYFVAVVAAMVIGFGPEAVVGKVYKNSVFQAYSPAIALTAFLLGYFISKRIRKGQAASFVWVIGLLWLMFGMYDETRYWSASWSVEKTHWGYIVANFFGPTYACSASECLGELLYTTPFAASIAYSIGACIRRRRLGRSNLSLPR